MKCIYMSLPNPKQLGHKNETMNKGTKSFIKRKIALHLVVLMSINSFAAVVGDNDGVAFITKAEFKSLKNM